MLAMTRELIVAVSGLSRLKTMERKSTSDRISDELRQMIIEGSLLPGEQLGEARIAEQLGVSRAPVREALQQLVQQKLLVASRNKGVTVVSVLGLGHLGDLRRPLRDREPRGRAHPRRRTGRSCAGDGRAWDGARQAAHPRQAR